MQQRSRLKSPTAFEVAVVHEHFDVIEDFSWRQVPLAGSINGVRTKKYAGLVEFVVDGGPVRGVSQIKIEIPTIIIQRF